MSVRFSIRFVQMPGAVRFASFDTAETARARETVTRLNAAILSYG
jgi:hypothetical protein